MLEGLEPTNNTRTCRIGQILSELDASDKQILNDALADTARWSANGLMNALRARGIQVSVHPILNHRKGICRC